MDNDGAEYENLFLECVRWDEITESKDFKFDPNFFCHFMIVREEKVLQSHNMLPEHYPTEILIYLFFCRYSQHRSSCCHSMFSWLYLEHNFNDSTSLKAHKTSNKTILKHRWYGWGIFEDMELNVKKLYKMETFKVIKILNSIK